MPLTFLLSESDKNKIGKPQLDILASVYGAKLERMFAIVELECQPLEEMRAINRDRRGIDEPTDVLSFPLFPSLDAIPGNTGQAPIPLGNIVLCPEKALLYGETLPQLVHHGLLHLLGFDHETDLEPWITEEGDMLALLERAGLTIPGIPL